MSYSMADFYSFKKIDAHLHYNTKSDAFVNFAHKCNMHLVSINVDFMENEWLSLPEQKVISLHLNKQHPDSHSFIAAVPLSPTITNGIIENACRQIHIEKENGAVGAKIWKNVGMKIFYKDQLVMMDNAIFQPLLDELIKIDLPLLAHLGEPRNCWLPLDEMTVNSDRKYYSSHPEFHMYQHKHMPSYEAQIMACNNMLENNTKLPFIGAHLGSSEYSIDEIAKRLDAYPNMYMDVAERVCHLQLQAIENHQKVYDFMVKYQDRLLYGSDMVFSDNKTEKEQINEVEQRWLNQWQFFTQNDVQTTWEVNGEFKGLGLPKSVIDKLYFKNALKAYPSLKKLQS